MLAWPGPTILMIAVLFGLQLIVPGNGHRPHRALDQASPLRAIPDPVDAHVKMIRRDRLGGLRGEYARAA